MVRTFKIFRFDPEKDKRPRFQTYRTECPSGYTVLDALYDIKGEQDGTLSYRRSCRSGICGSCGMKINGINRLACKTQVSILKKKVIYVEPLPGFSIIRDLVVDMEPFWEKLERVKPYLINGTPPPTAERYQSDEDQQKIEEATWCILCNCCTSSCPSLWANKESLGPAALLKAYRFVFDSRDEGAEERYKLLNTKSGVWRCHTIFNCMDACPQDINITDYISKLKTRIVSERY